MPSKAKSTEKKPKKKVAKEEEERVPKHVNIRLSYRDYLKLKEIAKISAKMKEDKDSRRAVTEIVREYDEDINADKFLGLIAGLPAKERTLERFRSQPPRAAPARMYFTDPERCSDAVRELHQASKKWTKGKLRYDQSKETCPTDVRVMFYAYIREKGLVEDNNPDITIDKFLKKLAPKSLSSVKHLPRKNGSAIWEICSEIRGVKAKAKTSKATNGVRRPRKAVEESESESEEESEEESEYEAPRRKGKGKKAVSSDEE